jgi:hypothetical protein
VLNVSGCARQARASGKRGDPISVKLPFDRIRDLPAAAAPPPAGLPAAGPQPRWLHSAQPPACCAQGAGQEACVFVCVYVCVCVCVCVCARAGAGAGT